MKYLVHLYALVRFPVEVEATGHQLAMEMARQQFEKFAPEDYADEIAYSLVDEPDDEDGTWYFGDGRTWGEKVAALSATLGVPCDLVEKALKQEGFSGT